MWFQRDLKKKLLIEDLRRLREVRYALRKVWIPYREKEIREWRSRVGINNSKSVKEFILSEHKTRQKILNNAEDFVETMHEEMEKEEELLRILDPENEYEVLGLADNASIPELKACFRRLAKKYHPDHGGDSELFVHINNAYKSILKRLESNDIN